MQSIAIGICLNNLINKANQWQKRTPLASFNYDDTSTSTYMSLHIEWCSTPLFVRCLVASVDPLLNRLLLFGLTFDIEDI